MIPVITREYVFDYAEAQKRGDEQRWIDEMVASGKIKLMEISENDPRITWHEE
jgi:hypothetical protein